MEVYARYRKIGLSPFRPKIMGDDSIRITAEVSDDIEWNELEKLAKGAAPEGYEYIEVIKK